MGLVIESATLAQALAGAFDVNASRVAYEARLVPGGRGVEWVEQTAGGETRYDIEPETSWLLRSKVELLSILPIEWLL